MFKRAKVLFFIFLLLILGGILVALWILPGAFSAKGKPPEWEVEIARYVRHLATPSHFLKMSNPISSSPEVVGVLTEALSDSEWDVRQQAAQALAAIGPEAVDALITALKSDAPLARWSAAEALAHIDPPAPAAVPALIDALDNEKEDWGVRKNAALALQRLGSAAKEAIDVLKKTLADPENSVAKSAKEEKWMKTSSVGCRSLT